MNLPLNNSTIALILLSVPFFIWLYFRLLPQPIPGIPHNKRTARRLLGDLPDALKWRNRTGETWSFLRARSLELNSPIFQMFMTAPFRKPWVVITDFRESNDIQTSRQGEFDRSNHFAFFSELLPGMHIWMPANDEWRAHRNLMRDTMSPGFLHKVVAPIIHTATQDLLQLWQRKAFLAKGRAFEADKDLVRSVVDLILLATFGTRIDLVKAQYEHLSGYSESDFLGEKETPVSFPMAKEPPTYAAIRTYVDSIQIGLSSPAPKQHMKFALNYYPSLVAARKYTHKLMDELLEAAWKKFRGQGGNANVDDVTCAAELVVQRQAMLAEKQDRSVIENDVAMRDELIGFYLAGHDSTATTLCWAVKRLAYHQDIQEKLRASLRSAYKEAADQNRLPSAEEIVKTSVPYMDAFIEENHRLGTAIPAHLRRTTRDTVILGHKIPKDTDVVMLTTGPSYQLPGFEVEESKRSPTSQSSKNRFGSWKPETIEMFDPERWLLTDETGATKFDPLAGPVSPFGGGLRRCFGIRFAILELKVMMTLLAWKFKFEETPLELSSFDADDLASHRAKQTYVKIVEVEN